MKTDFIRAAALSVLALAAMGQPEAEAQTSTTSRNTTSTNTYSSSSTYNTQAQINNMIMMNNIMIMNNSAREARERQMQMMRQQGDAAAHAAELPRQEYYVPGTPAEADAFRMPYSVGAPAEGVTMPYTVRVPSEP